VGQPDCSSIVKGEMRAEDGDNEKNSEGAETVLVVSSQRVVSDDDSTEDDEDSNAGGQRGRSDAVGFDSASLSPPANVEPPQSALSSRVDGAQPSKGRERTSRLPPPPLPATGSR
jgi:hypothetical protein